MQVRLFTKLGKLMPQQFFSKYNVFIKDNDDYILFNTLTGYALRLSYDEKSMIESGNIPEDFEDLFNEGFITDDINKIFNNLTLKKNILEPTLLLTYNCNFDCTYCFQKDYRNRSYVNDDVIEGFVNYINKNSNGRKTRVTFFGGEPLLNIKAIENISEKLKNIDYEFSIVTNGSLLTKNVADKLYNYGLRYVQITLDGPENVHDKRRYFDGGRGSFNIIMKNLKYAQDIFNVVLRINIDYSNESEIEELLESLKINGINNVRIDPHMVHENLFRNEAWDENIPRKNEYKEIKKIWNKIKENGFKIPDDAFRLGICVAHIDEDIIVDPYGNIYPCWAFTGDKKYIKGKLDKNGDITILNKNLIADKAAMAWKNDECIDCPYLPMCFGGCRFFSVLNGDSFSDKECRKESFKETLEFVKEFI